MEMKPCPLVSSLYRLARGSSRVFHIGTRVETSFLFGAHGDILSCDWSVSAHIFLTVQFSAVP